METEGFNLDSKFLGQMETDLNKEIKEIEKLFLKMLVNLSIYLLQNS